MPEIGCAAIIAKSNQDLTEAINKNSKSSDKLTMIWLILSLVIFIKEITPIKNFIINLF